MVDLIQDHERGVGIEERMPRTTGRSSLSPTRNGRVQAEDKRPRSAGGVDSLHRIIDLDLLHILGWPIFSLILILIPRGMKPDNIRGGNDASAMDGMGYGQGGVQW